MNKLSMQYSVKYFQNLNKRIFSNFLLDYHRDTTPKTQLLAFVNQTDCSLIDKQRHNTNIDKCDSVDVDINELIIQPWCSKFCPRCYTYK